MSAPPRLDGTDPAQIAAVLADLRLACDDVDAVVADMLRPAADRELGPALHRAHYADARAKITHILAYLAPHGAAPPAA